MIKKLERLDRTAARVLHQELTEAVRAVLLKRGIHAQLGVVRFTQSDFTVKVTGKLDAPVVGATSADEIAFKNACWKYDFNPGDFGRVVTIQGIEFRLIGFKKKAFGKEPKRPVKLEYVSQPGRYASAPLSMVKTAIN